jgi:hypothetical protein
MKREISLAAFLAVLLLAGYLIYPYLFESQPQQAPQYMPEVTAAASLKREQAPSGKEAISIPSGRNVTVSAYLKLQVSDVNSAQLKLSQIALKYNGYVQSSSIYEGGGYVTLRIPVEKLEDALRDIRSLGKVEVEQRNVEDVTERVLDVETRLKSLKATESRLMDLLNKAESVKDIIEIEDKLSQVRQQIEWLEAMRRNLETMINYATVNVELKKEGYIPPEEDLLAKIWEDSRKALIGSIYIIVVGASFSALPLLLIASIYLAYRRRRSSQSPIKSE